MSDSAYRPDRIDEIAQAAVDSERFVLTWERGRADGSVDLQFEEFRSVDECIGQINEWWDMAEQWEDGDALRSLTITFPGGDNRLDNNRPTALRRVSYALYTSDGPLHEFHGSVQADNPFPAVERFMEDAKDRAKLIVRNAGEDVYVVRCYDGVPQRVVGHYRPTQKPGNYADFHPWSYFVAYDDDNDGYAYATNTVGRVVASSHDTPPVAPPIPSGAGTARNYYFLENQNPEATAQDIRPERVAAE